jgi:hypothetical protein
MAGRPSRPGAFRQAANRRNQAICGTLSRSRLCSTSASSNRVAPRPRRSPLTSSWRANIRCGCARPATLARYVVTAVLVVEPNATGPAVGLFEAGKTVASSSSSGRPAAPRTENQSGPSDRAASPFRTLLRSVLNCHQIVTIRQNSCLRDTLLLTEWLRFVVEIWPRPRGWGAEKRSGPRSLDMSPSILPCLVASKHAIPSIDISYSETAPIGGLFCFLPMLVNFSEDRSAVGQFQ